jgi:hypothetical protein
MVVSMVNNNSCVFTSGVYGSKETKEAGSISIVGLPQVSTPNGTGADGTPRVDVTVTLNRAVPAGYDMAEVIIHTNVDYPQQTLVLANALQGTRLDLRGIYLHHNLTRANGEYLQITLTSSSGRPDIVLRTPLCFSGQASRCQ